MTRTALVLVLAAAACGHSTKPSTVGAGSGSGSGSSTGSGDGSSSGGGGGTDTATPPPAKPVENVTLAQVGLEAESLDKSADACSDFYQFACGGWLAKNEIPADRPRWGRFSEITERNLATNHEILEAARQSKQSDPVLAKLGAFYASCMDEKAVEKQGLTGIKPLQDLIGKVKDAKSLQAAMDALQARGISVAYNPFVEADLKDSTVNTLWLDSGGLGLPDRDYYVKDDFKAKRDAYSAHLVRLFKLLGRSQAKAVAGAANVIALETELAKVTKTAVERRDIPNIYHPTALADVAKSTPSMDWKATFAAVGVGDISQVVITTPGYLEAVDKLVTSQKPAVWQDYLTVRLVDGVAEALPKKFDKEHFALEQALSGVEQQKERWKRCVDATDAAMPEYLGRPFVAKAFPGESKKYANDLYGHIADAMAADFATLDWMSAETKAAAKKKLAKIQFLTGYPDKWKEYEFAVKANAYAANALAARAFESHRQAGKAGKPYDRSEWLMPAYLVNAYYNPSANNSALPAGILQPPFFGADRGVAVNYGAIGMVAGHELTHAFDDQGAQFDGEGRLANWWQKSDLDKFKAKGQCVSKQYSTFEALPGKFVNGDLTLGENIADLGGVKMAFNAYRNARKDAPKALVADGFTEDQQFFLGAAQAWCSKDRPAEIERRLTVDPHSPPRFRVYGAIRNSPEFAAAFQCAEGTPMHPKNICQVW